MSESVSGVAAGCACCGAAGSSGSSGSTSGERAVPRVPETRMVVGAPVREGGGPEIVCTLDGGLVAMTDRIGQWQAVIGRAVAREAADGGVTLVYEHDAATTVELARLAAAEFACCSFFSFTLAVSPEGMRFTITAPPEAQDVVTAVFGAVPEPVTGAR